jgi:hypothetical protein
VDTHHLRSTRAVRLSRHPERVTDERRGTVFIAYYEGEEPWFTAYWDSLPEEPLRVLGEPDAEQEVEPLLAWARDRAHRIVVRMPDGRHYWAGDDPCPEDIVPWDDGLLHQGRVTETDVRPVGQGDLGSGPATQLQSGRLDESLRAVTRPDDRRVLVRAGCADCDWSEIFDSPFAAASANRVHAARRCRG